VDRKQTKHGIDAAACRMFRTRVCWTLKKHGIDADYCMFRTRALLVAFVSIVERVNV
jgi:hypothetical protein